MDELLELYDPAFVYHPREDEPDASLHVGRSAYRQLILTWLEAFPQITFDVREIRQVGDYVISSTILRGRGGASGIEISDPYVFVYRVRDGRFVEGWEYHTVPEALEAIERM